MNLKIAAFALAMASSGAFAETICFIDNLPANFTINNTNDRTSVSWPNFASLNTVVSTTCTSNNGASWFSSSPSLVGGAFQLVVLTSNPNYKTYVNQLSLAKTSGTSLRAQVNAAQFDATWGWSFIGLTTK